MSITTCFCGEIRKVLCGYPLLNGAMHYSPFTLFQLPLPELHPMMLAFNASTPEKYVLLVIKKVRSR